MRFASILFLALAGVAVPAQAEVVGSGDAGFEVKLTAESTASRPEVWKALIAPARWWSGDHTYSGDAANMYIDAQASGCFCEKLPKPRNAPEDQRMGSVEHMHVVYADPQAGVLRMTGGLGPLQSEAVMGVLTISLKPGHGGTAIEWDYVVSGMIRTKAPIAPLVDKVLGEQLGRLVSHLDQQVPVEPAGAPPSL